MYMSLSGHAIDNSEKCGHLVGSGLISDVIVGALLLASILCVI